MPCFDDHSITLTLVWMVSEMAGIDCEQTLLGDGNMHTLCHQMTYIHMYEQAYKYTDTRTYINMYTSLLHMLLFCKQVDFPIWKAWRKQNSFEALLLTKASKIFTYNLAINNWQFRWSCLNSAVDVCLWNAWQFAHLDRSATAVDTE